MTSVDLSQTNATIIAALIGSVVATLTIVMRDVILEQRKEKRRFRRELIEKRLTDIYFPLWVASSAGKSTILSDEASRTQVAAHFHLLSPEMQNSVNKILRMGKVTESGGVTSTSEEGKQYLDTLPELFAILERDIRELQQEFNGRSRRRGWWCRLRGWVISKRAGNRDEVLRAADLASSSGSGPGRKQPSSRRPSSSRHRSL